MSSQKIILFDIDGTLLDSDEYGKVVFERMKQAVGAQDIRQTVSEYIQSLPSSTDFSPHDILSYLANRYHHPLSELQTIFFDREVFTANVYDDVIDCLDNLHGRYRLGIYSEGNTDFQLKKLELTGLQKYFQDDIIFVSRRKTITEVIETLPKEAIIIDNSQHVVEKVKNTHTIYWLDRSHKFTSTDPGITVIPTLRVLPGLLE